MEGVKLYGLKAEIGTLNWEGLKGKWGGSVIAIIKWMRDARC